MGDIESDSEPQNLAR